MKYPHSEIYNRLAISVVEVVVGNCDEITRHLGAWKPKHVLSHDTKYGSASSQSMIHSNVMHMKAEACAYSLPQT